MDLIYKIVNLFCVDYRLNNLNENFKQLIIKIETKEINIPEIDTLKSYVDLYNGRDKLFLDIRMDDYKSVSIVNDDYCEFTKELEEMLRVKDNDSVFHITLKIIKQFDNNNFISIFSLNSIVTFLKDRNFKELLITFKEAICDKKYIIFEMFENENPFYSQNIYFKKQSEEINYKFLDRIPLQKLRNKVCTYLNASQFDFVPEDFRLIQKSDNEVINSIMDKLVVVFSLIFISNISSIEDVNNINFKIDGFKWSNFTLDFATIDANKLIQYFSIYNWIYNEGNINDKIGLARNVITLHINNSGSYNVDESILNSIESNYKIYLKENVKQYIEVKNKLTESLLDISLKSDEIIKGFTNTFKQNIMTFLTFFATVLIMTCITSGKLTNIFTKDITMISFAMLAISVLFLVFSNLEIKKDIERFQQQYDRLRSAYDEILIQEDLNNIFKQGKIIKEDKEHIKDKIKNYSILWFCSIVVIFIFVSLLG